MRNALLIARRDLSAYLNGYVGYVIFFLILLGEGLFFNFFALGNGAQYSHDVLQGFFELAFGFTIAAGIFLTMFSITTEFGQRTDVLLTTSPVRDHEIIAGKYIAAMSMITLLTVLSIYMPALIFVNGKVSLSHIGVGYVGVLCVGSVAVSIGIFGSSLFRSDAMWISALTSLLAGLIAAFLIFAFILLWWIAQKTDPPFAPILEYAALFDQQYQPFMEGRLRSTGLVFYGSLSFVFLTLATRMLSMRRWS
ncbi:MAG: hypothetical protein R3F61_05215 [Myxococcota bacterium]